MVMRFIRRNGSGLSPALRMLGILDTSVRWSGHARPTRIMTYARWYHGDSAVHVLERASLAGATTYWLAVRRKSTVMIVLWASAIPAVQLLGSWPSGKGWVMTWPSAWDGFVWRQLTNAPTFSGYRAPNRKTFVNRNEKKAHLYDVKSLTSTTTI